MLQPTNGACALILGYCDTHILVTKYGSMRRADITVWVPDVPTQAQLIFQDAGSPFIVFRMNIKKENYFFKIFLYTLMSIAVWSEIIVLVYIFDMIEFR